MMIEPKTCAYLWGSCPNEVVDGGIRCDKHRKEHHKAVSEYQEKAKILSSLRHQTKPVYQQQREGIYEEVEKYLSVSLARWRKQLPELYEDAFQEGMIQAWRDIEAGMAPKLKIMRRASMSANKFCHRNGEYYFGKAPKSRDGITRDSKTLEKVKVFLDEYMPVHNYVYPTSGVVANATGLGRTACANALKRIREGRVDHMVYREDGRMDWNHYKTMSVEALSVKDDGSQGNNRSWTDSMEVAGYQSTFEADSVANIDLTNLLNQLADGPREILYLYLFEQYNFNDLGRHRGHTHNVAAKGNRLFLSAINQVKILMNPYEGECTAGHERTAETCLVERRKDGVLTRYCRMCRSENGNATVVRNRKSRATGKPMGRPPVLKCSKGHNKVEGRCKPCRAEAQKRYQQKKKNQ